VGVAGIEWLTDPFQPGGQHERTTEIGLLALSAARHSIPPAALRMRSMFVRSLSP